MHLVVQITVYQEVRYISIIPKRLRAMISGPRSSIEALLGIKIGKERQVSLIECCDKAVSDTAL